MGSKILKNEAKARELGAAFKKGYPVTYLKNQTKPIYRTSAYWQRVKMERLVYATGMP
jgi:hypothetical protein